MIPRVWWAESGKLALSDDGDLYVRYKRGWQWLGPIDEADPPAGHEADFARLLARFEAADDSRDLDREARATFRDGLS